MKPITALLLAPILLGATLLAHSLPQDSRPARTTPTEARSQLEASYEAWGRARVAYDREALEACLAEDFYVDLYGQRIEGDRFLDDVAAPRDRDRLTRFDVEVLTVRPKDGDWVAVIAEKIEVELPAREEGGEPVRVSSLWITRDGWRVDDGVWKVTHSEAIGHQDWVPGMEVPFQDW